MKISKASSVEELAIAGKKHFKPRKAQFEQFYYDAKNKKYIHRIHMKENLTEWWITKSFTKAKLIKELLK